MKTFRPTSDEDKTHPKRLKHFTLKDDILQQVGNQVEDTLLLYAPGYWPNEQLEGIEEQVVQNTSAILDTLSTQELQSSGTLRIQIANAVSEAKRLIEEKVWA